MRCSDWRKSPAKRVGVPNDIRERMAARVAVIEAKEQEARRPRITAERKPWFCPGCPHNTSTAVPEGSRALAGIGCHYLVMGMKRSTDTFSQMGGEGVPWLGQMHFTSDTHVFANLGDDGATSEDRLKIDASADMLIQSLAGAYRVGTWKLADFEGAGPLAVSVDPYAGLRYTYLDMELKGKLDLPRLGVDVRRTVETNEHWIDPIVGLRTVWTLGERWSLLLAGDVGGISTSDQYSAEAYGLAGYRFGLFGDNNADLRLGYRVLKQKYEDGDGPSTFEWDMTIHGPVVGLKINF